MTPLLGMAVAATVALAFAAERVATRVFLPLSIAALPARLVAYGLLFAFWLGLFARPLIALVATLVTICVLVAISVKKRRLVGEPLVFSDFGLLRLIVRHPDLYYTEALFRPPALAGLAILVAAIAVWLWAEPARLGLSGMALCLAAVAATIALAWWAARRPPLVAVLDRAVKRPDLERHLARWGLLLTLVAYALRWRAETARAWPAADMKPPDDSMRRPDPSPRGEGSGGAGATLLAAPDLLVVVQLESFLDPARRGDAPALPGLAMARERALLHGPLAVPAHGAYTMRSEFAVLSGISGEALGVRAFDPFLSVVAAGAPVPATLASRAAEAGWRSLFVHPFRPGFFDRERVMRRLGFERLLWEDDFAPADRRGPYVGDEALARRLLAEVETMPVPAFVMAVTMENHGPWNDERLPGAADPAARYAAHLAGSDRAIATLVEGLARRPGRALLCVYGDHPPILPGYDAARPDTDYVLVEFGTEAPSTPAPRELPLSADALGRLLAGAIAAPGATARP